MRKLALIFCALACGWTLGAAPRQIIVSVGPMGLATTSNITFVEATGTDFSATTGPTINYPTAVANDIWLMVTGTETTHSTTGTPPTGWTKLDEQDDAEGSDQSTSTFWRRATGSEGASEAWTGIFNASETGRAIIVVYRGCTTSGSPIDVQATPVNSPLGTAKSIGATTNTANAMCVAMFVCDPSAAGRTFTFDAGPTLRVNETTTPTGLSTGDTAFIAIADIIQASPGAVTISGDYNANETTTDVFYALKP